MIISVFNFSLCEKTVLEIVVFIIKCDEYQIFTSTFWRRDVFMVVLIFIAVLFKLFVTKSDQDFNLCYKTKPIKTFHQLAETVLFKNWKNFIIISDVIII